jgi:ketosteroid isomerase-like protein
MKKLLLITIVIHAIACNPNKPDNVDPGSNQKHVEERDPSLDSARAGIEKAWAEHTAADLKGDAIQAMKVFEDSAVSIEHGSPMLLGRTALDNYETEFFKMAKVLSVNHTIEGLTLQKDMAYQLGLADVKLVMKADGKENNISTRYMATWRKQGDGSWRILYFVYCP